MVIPQGGTPVGDHPSSAESIDFDEGNEGELAGHGIGALEAWQVMTSDPVWVRNKKGRAGAWLAVGRTAGGRYLTIVVHFDEVQARTRPITGWDSTVGERDRYR